MHGSRPSGTVRGWRFAAAALLALAVAACSTDDTPAPPDVDVLLSDAATAMGEVEGVRFQIALDGARLPIDDAGLLGFQEAEGRYAAPTSADALITVDAGGFVTQVGAVIVDGTTWLTNPVTGRWEVLPGGIGFDPTGIFDPEIGMRPLLARDLSNVRYIGEEERDGRSVHHLQGTATAARVAVITGGLVQDQDVTLDFWLDTADATVVAAEFANDTTDGTAGWTLSFRDYGERFDIAPPDTGA